MPRHGLELVRRMAALGLGVWLAAGCGDGGSAARDGGAGGGGTGGVSVGRGGAMGGSGGGTGGAAGTMATAGTSGGSGGAGGAAGTSGASGDGGGTGGGGGAGTGGSAGRGGSSGTGGRGGAGGAGGTTGTAGASGGRGGTGGAAGTTGTAGASGGSGTGGAAGTGGGGGSGAGGAAGTSGGGGTGGAAGMGGVGGAAGAAACTNLACRQSTCRGTGCVQPPCSGGSVTTLSGKIYDPAGKIPLHGVSVYVPNRPLASFSDGPSCDACETLLSGTPIVVTRTDASGAFVLGNLAADVPTGASIPLVIQVGKWRREVTIASVAACTDTALTDVDMTRLPRGQGEGHLPKIALTTGGADALECLLRKIGIYDSEFTPESGSGRVNFFAGYEGTSAYEASFGGASFTPANPWWDSLANLARYDVILHSCEGTENSVNKSVQARQALKDYADMGGRVFASHWHNYWFERGPAPWPELAMWHHEADLASPITSVIDTGFAGGAALADWLVNVGGSVTRGELTLRGGQHTIDAVGTAARRWIHTTSPASVQYLDARTPVGGPACGRVVLSDIHVSTGGGSASEDDSSPAIGFPSGCRTTDLSPQEKALEFMLFDLSSCTQTF